MIPFVWLFLARVSPQSEKDQARVRSIEEVANVGAVAILKNASVLNVGGPGFFKITVCSNKQDASKNPLFQYRSSDSDTPLAAECLENATLLPLEDPGGPGDRVSVTIDFDHPLISPFISSVWPQLHLTARREGIVEQYRTARVVGLPATISGPTSTPTMTFTPSPTFTASRYLHIYKHAHRHPHSRLQQPKHVWNDDTGG